MENTLSAKRPVHGKAKVKPGDLFAKILFIACACISIIAVFGIIGYILYGSIPAFRHIGFFEFLFGTSWNPTHDRFGILPMLVNSLIVTVGAALIGGTVGVFTAIFLAFWCPDKFHIRYRGRSRFVGKLVAGINKINLRTIFDQIIKVLAGIPSIVYGLFGLEVLVKLLSNFGGDGKGILACSILLAIMILPTVTSLSKNALDAVPAHYYEGALALGNTKAQAVFKVVVPAARSGIISALILGIGRAVGEAMAIVWVSGNRVLFPTGLFSYVRTLTTNIVMEMAYADTAVHRPALIATGLVLLVIVLLITLSLNLVPKEFKGKRGNKVLNGNAEAKPVFRKRGALSAVGAVVGIICAVLVGVTLAALVIYILVQGIGYMSHDFFFGEEGFFGEQSINVPTLWPALLGTLELIGITLVIALPVGICAAIYLNEYAKKGSVFVKIVRTFIDALAGVPSIVFGLFCRRLHDGARRPSHGHPFDGGGALCGADAPSRGKLRPRREQSEDDLQDRASFGVPRHRDGSHPFHRAHPRRVRGASLYDGYAVQLLGRSRARRKFALRSALYLRQRGDAYASGVCARRHLAAAHDRSQSHRLFYRARC